MTWVTLWSQAKTLNLAVTMALTSLLVCADAQAVQVLTRILQSLGISVESCGSPHAALTCIAEQQFDAVLVDCQDEPAAMELMAQLRGAPGTKDAIVIAMVDGGNKIRAIFDGGASFILYKPISAERAGNSMRAARSLIQQERRSSRRVPVEARASISYADTEDASVALVDLSEHGIAVKAGGKLPPECKVYFQFSLPQNRSLIRLSGEIMWQDSSGRMGIRFLNVPQASQRALKGWLETNRASLPQAEVSQLEISEETAEDASVTLSAGLGLLSVSAADRRDRSRRTCSLSAEVYRVGHTVPNRCRLSDVSAGGCYIETPLPFPAGTMLQIVVRTEELKLRIDGQVKSTHPGFGMGVRFDAETPEQQRHVQQLIACVAAEPEAEITT